MIPNFALNLTFDGISLLRRGEAGWTVLGEAALDGDLDAEMHRLRDLAESASPDGTCVKLVIPVDQVKFLELRDPGTDAARADAAQTALEGATPYRLDELHHDWSVSAGRLHVAALARETVDEAEAFALSHGFRPVMAVTMPLPRLFKGEPFFGPLPSWEGAAPTRDLPMRIVGAEPSGTTGAPVASKAEPTSQRAAQRADRVTSQSTAAMGTHADQGPAEEPRVPSPLNDGDRLTRPVPQRPDAEEVRSRLKSVAASDPSAKSAAPSFDKESEQNTRRGVFRKPIKAETGQPEPAVPVAAPEPVTASDAEGPRFSRNLHRGRETPDLPEEGAPAPSMDRGRKVGGKPRFLGLILTTTLLLFLVAVAAWASFGIDDRLAQIFRVAPDVVSDREPAEPDGAQSTQLAALDTNTDETQANPPTEGAARTNDAATGIGQSAPAPTDLTSPEIAPEEESLQALDAPAMGSETAALPGAGAEANDAPYPEPMSSADSDLDLDARELVRATREGAINADRVRVFAGLPPAVPPNRASVLPDAAINEAQSVEDVQRLQSLGGLRPRLRPAAAAPEPQDVQIEDASATIETETDAALAAIRPTLRPALEDPAEPEQELTATERAVMASLVPPQRPGDLAAVVEGTRRAAPQVAPRTVEPAAPSGSTVSERATVRNALDLRQMNLIGVYGEPSSRRALVRLPNGRYEKVKVGDSVDGGRIAAIGEDQLRYVKGGRNLTLRLP